MDTLEFFAALKFQVLTHWAIEYAQKQPIWKQTLRNSRHVDEN